MSENLNASEHLVAEERDRLAAILTAAVECLPFSFWAIGADGRYILDNASNRATWGEIVGKTPADVAGDDQTLATWLENNRRALAGEKVEGDVQFPVQGETRIYHNVIVPIRRGEEILGVLGVNVDVTDRHRADEALRQARDEIERRVEQRTAELSAANAELRLFQQFAEAAGQGFGISSPDGRIVFVNPTLCRIVGGSGPEDAIGRNVVSYFPADYARKRETEIIPALFRDGHWQGEYVLVSQQGKATTVLQDAILMRDEKGEPFLFATVFTDITDLKRTEEALRQSRDHLQTIYDGIIDGLLITDIETKRFVRVNSALCRMLGYSEEELTAASIQDIHPPEEVPDDLRRFQAVAEGRAATHENRPVLRKNGSIFYADITGRQILYNGRPCTLALFRDVSERKRIQEALDRGRRTLERLFRASDHERQLIAYEIHDGLAQFLAAAIMQFDASIHLQATAPKDSAAAFETGLGLLRQGHAEARRLIAGVRPPILDDEGIVAAVAHLVQQQRTPEGPTIEFHSLVHFDRLVAIQENAVYRIVQEGLTNACEYAKSDRVRVELLQEGDSVRIVIQDWGVGFDPSQVAESCYGLEGIRERARLFGGQSSVESAPGQGTRLSVEFPLVLREGNNG